MYKIVNGVQHVGVGVYNHAESWKWYRKFFGLDVPFFNAEAAAPLMDIYTNNETITKQAAMVMNLQGGGAMEVVQPTSCTPKGPDFEVQLGDYGIFVTQVKSKDVAGAYQYFKENGAEVLGEISKTPNGLACFCVKDPNGLIFQIVAGNDWYSKPTYATGGIAGCTIGVSNIERSCELYSELMGYEKVVYDETGVFEDWNNVLPGGQHQFRRVKLVQKESPTGGFGKLSGPLWIELVQVIDREPRKIYENRIWGDVGFVHLGFDVRGMAKLGEDLAAKGFPFTCDSSNGLHMGKTRVHCTYIEDPDGTLLELIEVYKIPLIEKWGWFMNVEKRDPKKPLPSFMLKAMRFSRVKD
jgi:catechol 2,3-dioxygenase-like lactoylglutathione lyase family enzyme/uncharacterized glyoxalase superfamily protein PhnB